MRGGWPPDLTSAPREPSRAVSVFNDRAQGPGRPQGAGSGIGRQIPARHHDRDGHTAGGRGQQLARTRR